MITEIYDGITCHLVITAAYRIFIIVNSLVHCSDVLDSNKQ